MKFINKQLVAKRLNFLKGVKRSLRIGQYAPLLIVMVGLIGITYSVSQLDPSKAVEPTRTFSSTSVASNTSVGLPYSVPTNISIPSVSINYPIIPVGQDANGVIQMPPILAKVTGWYKYGPTPGQVGPAVIVGHVDNYETISVFWRLRYVQPGALVYITRSNGSLVTFKVTSLEEVPQSNFPTKQVYGSINYPGLRLITCGGTFSHITDSYNENTVVFGSMVANPS